MPAIPKRAEGRRLRQCSLEISKEIPELRLPVPSETWLKTKWWLSLESSPIAFAHRFLSDTVSCPIAERKFTRGFLALMCTVGLVCIGPAAAHAGGQKKQQQSRGLPYAGHAPAGYHGAVGGAYHFNVPTNRSVPTGIGTQRGVQVVRPNTNLPYQPYIHQIGAPTQTRTPVQALTPSGNVIVTRQPMTGISAKNRNGPTTPITGIAPGATKSGLINPASQLNRTRDATSSVGSAPGAVIPYNPASAKPRDAATRTAGIGTAATEQFQQNRRIQGSDQWQGSNYQTLRSYRSEWHDRDWWRSHQSRIVFGAGGWYYWNAGYWFPAWGYDPEAHYAYDGPIYAYNDLPPDQVVANAQAALRPQGYYQAEADGLLGPNTRAAIVNYQRDHGLYETSTIDRPTLQSLGMK
jgi:Putative peptidoglycan binding domain